MFQGLIFEGCPLTFTIDGKLYAEKHCDMQNVGVIHSLLPKFPCICNPISILLTAQLLYSKFFEEIWMLLFHSQQKKLGWFSSLMWNFLLLVPEILECLIYTTNLCPFRLELGTVGVLLLMLFGGSIRVWDFTSTKSAHMEKWCQNKF